MIRACARHLIWLVFLLLMAAPTSALANTGEGNAEDVDGDGVTNREDRDADNDGILDVIECNSVADCPDVDNDGVPNHLDLDSDGDGITDAYEAFESDADGDGRYDGLVDQNRDGADDGLAETMAPPLNSDDDDAPDYLDEDADNDGLIDSVEGHDLDADGVPDTVAIGIDVDLDGLDDAFDAHCIRVDRCRQGMMPRGTPAPTPDHDGDGVDDFREPEEMSDLDAGPDIGSDAGMDADLDEMDAGPDEMDAAPDEMDAAPDKMDEGPDEADAGPSIGLDASPPDGPGAQTPPESDFYVDGGGCASAPTGEPMAIWWAWLLAIPVLRRRKR